ncbi:MAG: superfamily II DNA or RNA helicase [Alteromonadaceae bacterium]|jgi:superfamily II DNA or RNA helicase
MSDIYVKQLAKIDTRLDTLNDERLSLLNERKAIVAEHEASLAQNFNLHASPESKIELFLSYFKGREDIYPFRWESKNGRSGYSPACWNEWQPKICNKPKISCTDCTNQKFKVPDHQAIYGHLKGIQTIGVYPLLTNNSTYLLAADFDKGDWFDAVTAFATTCESLKLPYLLERSRSGNGGHIWIFFSEAVKAIDARRLGNGLLRKSMDLYPSLSFSCFDRLFPNQDVMPEGGFGNLIALPLQLEPRKYNNSVFINKEGIAYSDQWAILAATKKLSKEQLQQHLKELDDYAQITSEEGAKMEPWQKLERLEHIEIAGCPQQLTLTLADQLYIPIVDLPGKLTSTLKQCAVFSNPEFYKRQALRLSTIGTSRYICAAHIENDYLILPRGCLSDVITILSSQRIKLEHCDKRFDGTELDKVKFTGKLKSQQKKAVNTLFEQTNGVFVASTGFGKTVTGLALIAKRKVNTLILVHNRQLADQWLERIKVFLTNVEVGSLLGGKNKLTYEVDVATYQSLVSRNGLEIKPVIDKYGQILIDECHHLPASNYESLIKSVHAKFIHGLTATPKRQDGLEKLMHFQLGPVVYKAATMTSSFEQHVKVTQTTTRFPVEWLRPETKPHISQVYKHLVCDQVRNEMIVTGIKQSVDNDRSVMVLTERKEHIELLTEMIANIGINVVELHGGISAKQRQERIAFLSSKKDKTEEGEPTVILATGKYVGEGFDLPYLDTLFITLPIAWKGILAQYAGRIQREWSNKKYIQVYDYVDDFPTLMRMWKKRENGYKALGYKFDGQKNLKL